MPAPPRRLPGRPRTGAYLMSRFRLVLDPTACAGHGLCAELFPEGISLGGWGFPMIKGPGTGDPLKHPPRAAAACPAPALPARPGVAAHLLRPLQSAVVLIVSAATEVTPEIVDAVARLVPQLSRSAPAPTAAELAELVASPATKLFLARNGDGGEIVGMLTLV